MKLRIPENNYGASMTTLAFMLFGLSMVLDFGSTVLALSSDTQFVELNPLITGTGQNQIYSLIKLTLITATVYSHCRVFFVHNS